MKKQLKRILVCRTDAIGDSLLTLPVCTCLKKNLPNSHITFMVSRYTADLYAGQSHFDQLLVYDHHGEHQGKVGLKKLITALKEQHFDAALMVYPDQRLSWAVYRSGVPLRLGTGRRWWSILYNKKLWHSRKKTIKHEAEYNLDFVSALGFEPELELPRLNVADKDLRVVDQLLSKLDISKEEPLVIIHPGGRGSSANWTQDAYAQLVLGLLNQDSPKVLLTGVGQEIQKNQAIRAYCEKHGASRLPAILTSKVNLMTMAALIKRAQLFLSGNTGPMHIAAAVNIPLIALFPNRGVTGPDRWKPLSSTASLFMPKENGQFTDTLGMTAVQIDPKQVIEKINSILSST